MPELTIKDPRHIILSCSVSLAEGITECLQQEGILEPEYSTVTVDSGTLKMLAYKTHDLPKAKKVYEALKEADYIEEEPSANGCIVRFGTVIPNNPTFYTVSFPTDIIAIARLDERSAVTRVHQLNTLVGVYPDEIGPYPDMSPLGYFGLSKTPEKGDPVALGRFTTQQNMRRFSSPSKKSVVGKLQETLEPSHVRFAKHPEKSQQWSVQVNLRSYMKDSDAQERLDRAYEKALKWHGLTPSEDRKRLVSIVPA